MLWKGFFEQDGIIDDLQVKIPLAPACEGAIMGQKRVRGAVRVCLEQFSLWEPVEAKQLSPVELLSLRSGPFLIPVKTFQWLPTAYKVNSRYFAGRGSLPGQDSNHSASLVTAYSLPGHLKSLSVRVLTQYHTHIWNAWHSLVYPFRLTSDTISHHIL